MKTTFSLCLAVLAVSAVHAQILRPEAVNGALLGGIAGAVIGHNSGDLRHNAWRGAAIGAGTGLIAGEMVGNHNAARRSVQVPGPAYRSTGGYIYRESPVVYAGYSRGYGGHGWARSYGHRTYGHRTYGHYSHPYSRSHGYYGSYRHQPGYSIGYYPGYDYGYSYPSYGYGSYGAQGLFWGGLAGAIIGHNSGTFRHDAWRGAAWGAGTGWLLGTIADASRRAVAYETPVAYPATAAPVQPAASAQPQQVTIINNYYNAPATPMSGANGLFGR